MLRLLPDANQSCRQTLLMQNLIDDADGHLELSDGQRHVFILKLRSIMPGNQANSFVVRGVENVNT